MPKVEGMLNSTMTQMFVLKEHAISTTVVKQMWKLLWIRFFVPFWDPQALYISREVSVPQIPLTPTMQVYITFSCIYMCVLYMCEYITFSYIYMYVYLYVYVVYMYMCVYNM